MRGDVTLCSILPDFEERHIQISKAEPGPMSHSFMGTFQLLVFKIT